ncbi:hypothetical protein ABQD47_09440 [Providencia rettgeri]|uniref:hypothetical protein n=1 Tax=Providencia TaxID=586 RepID=UPI000D933B16|nr:Uncharacterised protein [Providencia rustigianii]
MKKFVLGLVLILGFNINAMAFNCTYDNTKGSSTDEQHHPVPRTGAFIQDGKSVIYNAASNIKQYCIRGKSYHKPNQPIIAKIEEGI